MLIWKSFWQDETGVIVSAELVTIATVGVVGMTVGLNTVATSVNAELTDVARAIRSLNQSYRFSGFSSCRAYTAGSSYTQQPVDQALVSLCACPPGTAPGTASVSDETAPSTSAVVTPAEEKVSTAANPVPANPAPAPAGALPDDAAPITN